MRSSSQPFYVGVEVIGGRAVIDQTFLRVEPPPAPDVVRGVFGIEEGYELEVGSVLERYERVTRQAVGVLRLASP